jgi:hypothetical protein
MSERGEREMKEEVRELIQYLSLEEVFDLLCAPEATDDLEDIEFDEDDIDEVVERGLIEGWIEEEAFQEYNMSGAHGTKLA